MRSPDEAWYQGTADAIYQNINLVEQSDPHVVAIFGADHIYRMNIASMIDFHVQRSAEVTVAAIPVAKQLATELGVIETAPDGHIAGFHEKNPDAPTIPGDAERVYASMGNYIFSTRTLLRLLHDDAADESSGHDFGRDILPKLAGKAEIFAYDFQTSRIPGEPADSMPYWRDVGTIDSYYEANMDLRSVTPELNLYNREWPVRTTAYPDPPAKFTFDEEKRRGQAIDSIVSGGCLLSGGVVRNSVLGRGVRVHAGALVEDCVILDNCDIGRRSKIRRAILDKNVRVPDDAIIGYDLDQDRRNHHVTESGIVVVAGNRSRIEITSLVV
jgi:glucose-1-phosphate adenylyltransferase